MRLQSVVVYQEKVITEATVLQSEVAQKEVLLLDLMDLQREEIRQDPEDLLLKEEEVFKPFFWLVS